jgi:hypothetical protein
MNSFFVLRESRGPSNYLANFLLDFGGGILRKAPAMSPVDQVHFGWSRPRTSLNAHHTRPQPARKRWATRIWLPTMCKELCRTSCRLNVKSGTIIDATIMATPSSTKQRKEAHELGLCLTAMPRSGIRDQAVRRCGQQDKPIHTHNQTSWIVGLFRRSLAETSASKAGYSGPL